MGISPWFQGDGQPLWTLGLQPDSGPLNVSGLTTSDFTLVAINSVGQEIDDDGVFSNLTAASGSGATAVPASIVYQVGTKIINMPGSYDIRVVIKKGIVGQQRTFKFGQFVVER